MEDTKHGHEVNECSNCHILPKPADIVTASFSKLHRVSGSATFRGSHKIKAHVLEDGRRRWPISIE